MLLMFAAAAGLLLLAACSDDDDADDSSASEAALAPSAYPLTVTDLLGREVEIAARPTKVVALSPTAVELVYAAGGTVIGRSASVDYPEAALTATDVGIAYQPNFEIIASLTPDLIVADSVLHAQPQLQSTLEELSTPVVFAGAENVDDMLAGLALLGSVFNTSGEADAQLAAIGEALDAAAESIGVAGVSAVILIADRDQTLYAAKANSWAGDIMARLGIENPAAEQPDAGPFPGYTAIPIELLLQFDPDYVFTVTPAPEPAPRLNTLIPQIPPFQGLSAVQGERVFELDLELFLQAPGPRVVDAVRALEAIIAE